MKFIANHGINGHEISFLALLVRQNSRKVPYRLELRQKIP